MLRIRLLGRSRSIYAKLSHFQVFAFTSTCYLSLTYWYYPRTVVQYAGPSAVWSMVGFFIAALIVAGIHSLHNYRFATKNAVDVAFAVFGRPLASCIIFLYIVTYIAYLSTATFSFTALVIKQWLQNTPIEVLTLSLILIGFAGAWYGVESLARVAWILGAFSLALFAVCLIIPMFEFRVTGGVSWSLSNLGGTFEGVYQLMPLLLGFNVLLMLSPMYVQTKQAIFIPFLSVTLAWVLVAIGFISCIFIFGYAALERTQAPIPLVLAMIHVPGGLFARFGSLVILITTAFNSCYIGNNLWAISTLMAQLFGKDPHNYKRYLFVTTLLAFSATIFFKHITQPETFSTYVLTPVSWMALIIIPCITIGISMVRGIAFKEGEFR